MTLSLRGLLRSFLHSHQWQLLQPALLCCVMELGINRIRSRSTGRRGHYAGRAVDGDRAAVRRGQVQDRQRPSGRSPIVWDGARGLAPACNGPVAQRLEPVLILPGPPRSLSNLQFSRRRPRSPQLAAPCGCVSVENHRPPPQTEPRLEGAGFCHLRMSDSYVPLR
jgi:hypothetical protein